VHKAVGWTKCWGQWLALLVCILAVAFAAYARFKLIKADTYALGHRINVDGLLTDGGTRPPHAECKVIRYESADCGVCRSNREEWLRLRALLEGEGCEVFEMSSGPKDEVSGPGHGRVHSVRAITIPTAEQITLAGTPSTLVLDQKDRVVWSRTGPVGASQSAEIVRRLRTPIWLNLLRFEGTDVARMESSSTPFGLGPRIEHSGLTLAKERIAYGLSDAPIRIVEFADFECPYCAAASGELRRLNDAYPGKICVSLRMFPLSFHRGARLAAAAAVAASRQGKLGEMHDLLFSHFRALNRDVVLRCSLELGLDERRFLDDLASSDTLAAMEQDMKIGRELGVQGTPTIFINGHKYTGPVTEAALRPIVEAELRK